MNRAELPKPTEAELAILHALWELGPATVRQVQDRLETERGTGYTTTLKLMQIMFEKGLVLRNESNRSHVYTAAVSRQKTQRQLIGQFLDQVFDGSAQQLILQALSAKKSSRSELAEIRKLLDQLEGGAK
jgi:predicted transcriptional regulator